MEGRNYVDSMLVNVFQTIDPSLGTSLVPALTTTADNVDASYASNPVTGDATPFRVTFSGVLTADADGNYLFRLPAADGAVLTIDGQSVILQPSLPGDGNLTGNVNFADYQNLMSHYGMTSGATWAQGDFNGDGAVNFADYQILNDNYGQTVTARAIDDTNTTGFYLAAGRHTFQLSYYQFNNSGNPLAQLQWQTPGSSSFTTIDAAHFAKLPAPTGITAAHDFVTDAVDLSWANPARATQTLVQRSDDGGATWHALATVPVTAGQATSAYADATVAALSRPQYRLVAEDGISRDGLGDDLDKGGVPSDPVAAGPAITTAASASPSAITDGGTTATLTVAAAEDGATASDLYYTWNVVSEPAGAADPDFANNGTTDAATTTATFHDAGTYVLSAQADDGLLTSDPADGAGQVTVQVYPRLTSVAATTGGATVPTGGGSYQLGAVGLDQFGHALYNAPGVTWTVTGGSGSGAAVTAGGLFTAPSAAAGTTYVLTAHATQSDSLLGSAAADVTVTITQGGTASTPTAAPNAVTDVIASPGQDGDATLAWSNPATGAAPDGYRIEASDDGGTTFTPVGTAAPGATTFLATGLTGNAPYLFRVTPFNAAGNASSQTTVTAVTPDGYADANWYKVTLNVPGNPTATTAAFTQGSSDTTTAPGGSLSITTAAQANGDWVQADSAAQAVSKALSGTFVSGTDGASYPFATSGALRYDPDLVLPNGTDVGPAVVAEEKFNQVGHGDADYNDAYVPVSVSTDGLWVRATADTSSMPPGYMLPFTAPTAVGSFDVGDEAPNAVDYTATVQWSGGTTAPAVLTDVGDGTFYASVDAPAGADLSNYTLAVTNLRTGRTASDDMGAGGGGTAAAPPAGGNADGDGSQRLHTDSSKKLAAPNIQHVVTTDTSVNFDWLSVASGATYKVYRLTGTATKSRQFAGAMEVTRKERVTVSSKGRCYFHNYYYLSAGTTYSYEVLATRGSQTSSSIVTVPTTGGNGGPAAPTNVVVTLQGGGYPEYPGYPTYASVPSGGTLPQSHHVAWNWSGSLPNGGQLVFDVYRLDPQTGQVAHVLMDAPASSVATASGYAFNDPIAVQNVADPTVYTYQVTATVGGQTAKSDHAYAPQIFYVEGLNDTVTGPALQYIYGAQIHAEVHYFQYNDSTIASNLIQHGPQAKVLLGFSFGGSTVVSVAHDHPDVPVRFLGLVDPVPNPWPDNARDGTTVDPTLLGPFSIASNVQDAEDWYDDRYLDSGQVTGSIVRQPVRHEIYGNFIDAKITFDTAPPQMSDWSTSNGIAISGSAMAAYNRGYSIDSIDVSGKAITVTFGTADHDPGADLPDHSTFTFARKEEAYPSSPIASDRSFTPVGPSHLLNNHPIGTFHGSQLVTPAVVSEIGTRVTAFTWSNP